MANLKTVTRDDSSCQVFNFKLDSEVSKDFCFRFPLENCLREQMCERRQSEDAYLGNSRKLRCSDTLEIDLPYKLDAPPQNDVFLFSGWPRSRSTWTRTTPAPSSSPSRAPSSSLCWTSKPRRRGSLTARSKSVKGTNFRKCCNTVFGNKPRFWYWFLLKEVDRLFPVFLP